MGWWQTASKLGKLHIAGLPLFAIACALCGAVWWTVLGPHIESDMARHYVTKILSTQDIYFDVEASVDNSMCKVRVSNLSSDSWDGLVQVKIEVVNKDGKFIGEPVTALLTLTTEEPRLQVVAATFGPYTEKFDVLVSVTPYVGGGL